MNDIMQDIEDALEAVISDSLEPEWTPRSAARHIAAQLADIGLAPTSFSGGIEPDQRGSFKGDLWYGELSQPALPTHQWDGGCWRKLPELLRHRTVAV